MDTPIIVTPYGILVSLLILTGLVAMVFLAMLLYKAMRLLGKINKFVDDNSKPVTESIKMLPEITENVSISSKNISEITESAGELIEGFDGITRDSGGDGILGKITIIANIIQDAILVFRSLTGRDD